MPRPRVFVSSTWVDLRLIREMVHELISGLDLTALRSEVATFPITPDESTISSCLAAIENEADIYVVIIGGRFGSQVPGSEKSLTMVEYEAALKKGIPLYAFVDKKVQLNLETYQSNRDGDFSHVVDNVKIFDFLDKVQNHDKVWIVPFSDASEIIVPLRGQLAELFGNALAERKQLRSPDSDWLRQLSPRALRILIEAPELWEYELLFTCLADEIEKLFDSRLAQRHGLALGPSIRLDLTGYLGFSRDMIEDTLHTISAMNVLMDSVYQEAIGKPGEPGDPRRLLFVAKELAAIYHQFITLSLKCHQVVVPRKLWPLMDLLSQIHDELLAEFESMGPRFLGEIKEVVAKAKTGADVTHTFSIKIESSALSELGAKTEELSEEIESDPAAHIGSDWTEPVRRDEYEEA